MIVFDRVTHRIKDKTGIETILEQESGIIPVGRYALLSANAAAKTALINLICGICAPQEGQVNRSGMISWPIGRMQHLRSALTVGQTLAFFADVYDLDADRVQREVLEMANLIQHAGDPIIGLHPMTTLKMSLAMALIPPFEIFVFDGVIRHPDTAFDKIWYDRLLERTEESVVVMSTTQPRAIFDFCDTALILDHRQLFLTQDVETALQIYPLRVFEQQIASAGPETDDDDLL